MRSNQRGLPTAANSGSANFIRCEHQKMQHHESPKLAQPTDNVCFSPGGYHATQ
jgi:hypothetical protein